jgi:hypothetical protein
MDQECLKPKQSGLEAALVNVIKAPEPYPAPGRALRNLVARCLITLYTRAESRTLFDTLQSLVAVVGDFKMLDKDVYKMYAVLHMISI